MNLFAYVRVSTDEQARTGLSLEVQRARTAAYAEALGHTLVRTFTDEGVSGGLAPRKRPALSKLLHALDQKEAEGVVVVKLDRLSRSVRDVLDLVDASRRGDFALVSVAEQLDTGTASGRMVVTVLAALAELEREQIGERTHEALAHRRSQGRSVSRFTPFGWRMADGSTEPPAGHTGKLEAHPPEQAVLAEIRELRAQGLGARRIAKALHAAGHPNPRTKRPMSPSLVAKILNRD